MDGMIVPGVCLIQVFFCKRGKNNSMRVLPVSL